MEQSSRQITAKQMARFSLIQGFSVAFQLGRCILQKMLTFMMPSHELMNQKRSGGRGVGRRGEKRRGQTGALICNASAGAGIRRSQRAAVGNRGFGVSASLLTKINFPRTGTLSTHSTLSTQSRIWHEVGCRISS